MQARRAHIRRAGGFGLNSLEWRPMSATIAELQPHARSPCSAVHRIAATVERDAPARELRIRYRVGGDIGLLLPPLPDVARRRDGLWQHTCFEMFLQPDARDFYYEFNFTPSGDWAAYRFGARRADRSLPDLPAPRVAFHRGQEHCELMANVSLAGLPELADAEVIRAGLAAVIEARDGPLSYWALAHAGETPDFHDPTTFTLRLAAP
jgi:hypothetical protein